MAKSREQKRFEQELDRINRQTKKDMQHILSGGRVYQPQNTERKPQRKTGLRAKAAKRVALLLLGVGALYPLSGVVQDLGARIVGAPIGNSVAITDGSRPVVVENPLIVVTPTAWAAESTNHYIGIDPIISSKLEPSVLYWQAEVTRVVRYHPLTAQLSTQQQAEVVQYVLAIIAVETRGMYQAGSRVGASGLMQVMPNMHYGRIQSCNATWSVNETLVAGAPATVNPVTSSDQVIQKFLENPTAQICAGIEVFMGDFHKPESDASVLAAFAGYNGGNAAKSWINTWLSQVPADQMPEVYAALAAGDMANIPAQAAYTQGKQTYIGALQSYYPDLSVRTRKADEVEKYIQRMAQWTGLHWGADSGNRVPR